MMLSTQITCYPEIFKDETLKKIIHIFFDQGWISPTKYGKLSKTYELPNKLSLTDWENIVNFYKKNPSLIIYGKQTRYLDFYKYENGFKFSTTINHYSESFDKSEFGLPEYNDAITKVMELTKAFYADCQTGDAQNHYLKRLEQRVGFKEEVLTVNGLGEGLTNPAWKMWFGEKYIKEIGREKLMSAPCLASKDYGKYIFIHLFTDPEEWQTAETLQRVEAFKEVVGYDYFYDPANIQKKLKTPDFGKLE